MIAGEAPIGGCQFRVIASPAVVAGENHTPIGAAGNVAGMTVKTPWVVAEPVLVTTVIGPVVALAGTTAVNAVLVVTANDAAGTPLNLTAVTSTKFAPPIPIVAPGDPVFGANQEKAGGGTVTTKDEMVVAVPDGVLTEIGPLVAAAGTEVVIVWLEVTVNNASTPLNLTWFAPVNRYPPILT